MTLIKRLLAVVLAASIVSPSYAAISSYSTTASSNVNVDGTSATNVAEGNPPGTVNDAIRAMMADLASFYSATGTKFTGNVTIGDSAGDVHTINGYTLVGAASSAGAGTHRLQVGAAGVTAQSLVASATSHIYNFASSTSDSYIAWKAGGALYLGTGPADGSTFTERLTVTGTDVYPGSDNSYSLGTSSRRWSVVYAGTGSINTSDEREKEWRGAFTAAELRAAKRIIAEIGAFRWLSDIAAKGEAAQIYFGVRAQKVAAILADEGLDAGKYAMTSHETWQEGGVAKDRWGIRPDALLFFLVAAQEQRLAVLEAQ